MPTIDTVVAGALLVSLTIYALSGGADFGGGVWVLFARGKRKKQQVELIENAIGPIWEANHVWLILAVVILFFAFPPAFGLISTTLNIPLTIMLVGIVLRGSAFTFQAYDRRAARFHDGWGRLFAIASLVTPMMLGVIIGAIATGGAGGGLQKSPYWYLTAWLAPFPFVIGFLALSNFALLAACYLLVETDDRPLQEDFRRRALWAAFLTGIFAFIALFLVQRGDVPILRSGLVEGWLALVLHGITGLAALSVFAGLWLRWYAAARLLVILQVTLVIWGWAFNQFPLIVPPHMTFTRAAAPANVLWALFGALLVGAAVLVPSMWYLYWVFGKTHAHGGTAAPTVSGEPDNSV